VAAWFATGSLGIGVVCGAVSGGLEMLELEGRAIDAGLGTRVADLARVSGLATLWQRLVVDGYCESTPSGGVHLLYRVAGGTVPHSIKLARRPATLAELATDPDDRIKVLAETRGEGGYTVVAPSCGTVHPTGRPWVALRGATPRRIPTISAAQRDALIAVVRCLDAMPAAPPAVSPARSPAGAGGAPGHDYERRADWADILRPAGWTLVYAIGRTRYWRRPGKRVGISATTGRVEGRDRLYVFSTSTPLEVEVPITKFHAYAVLNHNADHVAAARALWRAGYGS
jgi:putative DNA primase/helicase